MRPCLTLLLACACGPLVADSTGESSTNATTTSGTSAIPDDHGTSEPFPPSTSTSGASTGAAEASGNELPGSSGGVSLDLGPEIERCEASGSQQIDLVLTGPDGIVATAYGWWGWEVCCVNDPWLVLSDASELELTNGQIITPHFAVYVQGDWDQRGAYVGPQPIWFDLAGQDVVHETGFELLEPLDPELSMEAEQPSFSGAFAIETADWSAQGSVLVPHCKALDTPPCPCE